MGDTGVAIVEPAEGKRCCPVLNNTAVIVITIEIIAFLRYHEVVHEMDGRICQQ
jgi:hypothetical protein